jgi:RNA polymerase sigma factor (sigma-70 family)
MTGALPLWPDVSDGDLARADAEGDRQAFAEIYDRYSDRLYDYCVGMIGDRDAAADCVQDAFCVAATDLGALREPDKLRPWLYSITRHHAMRRLRHRYREEVSDAVPDSASQEPGPDAAAGQSELARLVAEAAGGLSDRDRELLELSYRHGLDGPELAEALGVTLTSASTMVFRMRQTVERCLGALLVARGARADSNACPELVAILQGWDGQLTVLMRKRIARHIESCHTCTQEQRRRVNPVALLGGTAVFIPAPEWLRGKTLDSVELTSASSSTTTSASHSSGSKSIGARITLLVGAPLVCLGVAMVWFAHRDTPIAPVVEIGTDPTPSQGPLPPTTGAASSPPIPARPTAVPTPRTAPVPPRQPSSPEVSAPEPTPEVSAPIVTPEVSAPIVTPEVSAPNPPPIPPPVPPNGTGPGSNPVTPPWPENGTGSGSNPVTPPWPGTTLPPLISPVVPIPVVPTAPG